ncbi:VWA domain-containing protein [Methanospirillum stamsii]|uniref:Magnesium chelatase n=1 Tax=Methanospirillum stamsii TaxID=1277351 RepID=A0A2V2N798_9EURY|nr:VWA domain-containing protein [Methanospirillum stamsii]PWR75719.1 magnesium chelatase [Methanospirillum stamsii]
MNFLFPFSGIVGQENAKKALLCSLVHEDIRSVLIIGDPGSAKSTLVRSVGTIEDKPIQTIPQAVTFDRLMGMIDLEKAVTSGSIQVTPGLLEEGDGQILYADNVNLMEEGIVNNILNTSDTGHFILEREGLSHHVTTRFTFFATMDPAEGELSPGQMDRFDLCVRLDRIDETELRAEIVRNQLKFETKTKSFLLEQQHETDSLKEKVTAAQDRLPYVSIPEALQDLVSSLCLELAVEGQRGDLAATRAACALAALDKRDEVNFQDIKEAALLALEHRRREKPGCPPPEPPEENKEKEDNAQENRQDPDTRQPPEERDEPHPEEEEQKEQDRGIPPPPPVSERVFDIGATFEVIRYLDEQSWQATRKQKSGRRTRVQSTDTSGHYHAFRLPVKNQNDIAIDATLRAAAPYQRHRKRNGLAISVTKGDIREKVREKKVAHTILFLVDASGSMGVQKRMIAVKGAILSLLHDAYLKRDRVGLMIFRGKDAHLLLPPTKSPDHAAKMLKTIPTGGMTPLGKGLIESCNLLTRGRFASTDENRSIVILTDGRGNVPINGKSPSEELKEITEKIAFTGIRYVVVDTEAGFPRLGRAQVLAGNLNALYFRLEELGTQGLAGSVQNTIYSPR